ncbi:MAG: hypothetical protein QNJ13_05525 [Paracoccaceae bacterium]|nr:hypothetical protein [Paracoccaceae bacterium]
MKTTGHRWTFWTGFCGLALVTAFWAVFALFSGAGELGGGWQGLWRNAPNALPWVLALGALGLAYVRPMAGGLVFAALGMLSVVYFDTWRHPATFATITAPYLVFGSLLALSARLDGAGA